MYTIEARLSMGVPDAFSAPRACATFLDTHIKPAQEETARNAMKRAKKKLPGFRYTKGNPSANAAADFAKNKKPVHGTSAR
jgi:ribosomal protein L16/L10AE